MGRCGLRAVSIRDCRRGSKRVLSSTRRAIVASGIVTIWTATPEQLGSATAELEASYPGRFLLGLGEAATHRSSSSTCILTAGWSSFSMRSTTWMRRSTATGECWAPSGPWMLELAAARALGAHPYFVPVEHTERARRIMEPVRSSHPR